MAELRARQTLRACAELEKSAPKSGNLDRELEFVHERLIPTLFQATPPVFEVLGRSKVAELPMPEGAEPEELHRQALLDLMDAYEKWLALSPEEKEPRIRRFLARMGRTLANDRQRLAGRRNLGLRVFSRLAGLIRPSAAETASSSRELKAALLRDLDEAASTVWVVPTAEAPSNAAPTIAPDSSWLKIGDTVYRFTTTRQRAAISALHEEWARGGDGCGLTADALAENMGLSVERPRVDQWFKGNSALGTILRKSQGGAWALYIDLSRD